MTPFRAETVQAELRACLRTARRSVHVSNVRDAVLRTMRRVAWLALLFAAFFLLARIGMALGGVPDGRGLSIYPWILAAAAIVVALAGVLPAALSAPSWSEAAERLDLAAHNHNRIATALALASAGPHSAFAQAAMLDGLDTARRLARQRPYLSPPNVRSRQLLTVTSVAVALHVAGLFVTVGGARGTASDSAWGMGAPSALGRPTTQLPLPRSRPDAVAVSGQQIVRAAAAAVQRAVAGEPAGAQPPASPPTAAGASGSGGSGRPSPRVTAGGLAAATGSSSRTERAAARPHAATAAPRLPEAPRAAVRATEDAAPVSPGSSGGGAASPVSHDWAQRETSTEREDQDSTDEPVEDEQSMNTQRGGLQPLLKDRQESPSRDLGMSGPPEGPPGTGRGGPTPPKKSRGTASLVLGVPIPDFVRGKVGPGTTRVVQEQVGPVAMPGAPAEPVEAAARRLPEAPVPRPEVLGELAAVIRDYLVALHAADRPGRAEAGHNKVEEPVERSEP